MVIGNGKSGLNTRWHCSVLARQLRIAGQMDQWWLAPTSPCLPNRVITPIGLMMTEPARTNRMSVNRVLFDDDLIWFVGLYRCHGCYLIN
jgi:hypothetical protein